MFVLCAIAAALFLGGYHVPFHLGGDGFVAQLLQLAVFLQSHFLILHRDLDSLDTSSYAS